MSRSPPSQSPGDLAAATPSPDGVGDAQFLLSGPPAARSPDALSRLTLLSPAAPRLVEAREQIPATPFPDLEREWSEWIGE